MPADTDEFRSRFSRGLAIALWGLCAIVAGSLPFSDQPRVWLLGFVPLAAAWLVYLAYWRPRVRVDRDGVEFVNTLRTVHVPWSALEQVETRFALTLVTARGRFVATAAPAPGALGTYSAAANLRARLDEKHRHVRPSDLDEVDSGSAAAMVLEHWNAAAASGVPRADAESAPVVHWHALELALAALLLAGAVVAVVQLRG